MHSVLGRAQVPRADRKALHDGLHLIQGEPIRASWMAVAKRTGEVALVGEPEPQRDEGVGLGSHLHVNLKRNRSPIQSLVRTSARVKRIRVPKARVETKLHVVSLFRIACPKPPPRTSPRVPMHTRTESGVH